MYNIVLVVLGYFIPKILHSVPLKDECFCKVQYLLMYICFSKKSYTLRKIYDNMCIYVSHYRQNCPCNLFVHIQIKAC